MRSRCAHTATTTKRKRHDRYIRVTRSQHPACAHHQEESPWHRREPGKTRLRQRESPRRMHSAAFPYEGGRFFSHLTCKKEETEEFPTAVNPLNRRRALPDGEVLTCGRGGRGGRADAVSAVLQV